MWEFVSTIGETMRRLVLGAALAVLALTFLAATHPAAPAVAPANFTTAASWELAPVANYTLAVATLKCGEEGGGTHCECYGDSASDAGVGNCSPTDCTGCPEGETCGGQDCRNGMYGPCNGCPVNGYTDKWKCLCAVWVDP